MLNGGSRNVEGALVLQELEVPKATRPKALERARDVARKVSDRKEKATRDAGSGGRGETARRRRKVSI